MSHVIISSLKLSFQCSAFIQNLHVGLSTHLARAGLKCSLDNHVLIKLWQYKTCIQKQLLLFDSVLIFFCYSKFVMHDQFVNKCIKMFNSFYYVDVSVLFVLWIISYESTLFCTNQQLVVDSYRKVWIRNK